MKTCNCCYDDEVLPIDIVFCNNGCEFCRTCVEKSVLISFGEGILVYNCLAGCTATFSVQTLQVNFT